MHDNTSLRAFGRCDLVSLPVADAGLAAQKTGYQSCFFPLGPCAAPSTVTNHIAPSDPRKIQSRSMWNDTRRLTCVPAFLSSFQLAHHWSQEIGKETCLPAQPAHFPLGFRIGATADHWRQTMAVGIQHMIFGNLARLRSRLQETWSLHKNRASSRLGTEHTVPAFHCSAPKSRAHPRPGGYN